MSPWVVNLLESLANVAVGAVGVAFWQRFLPGLRQTDVAVTGVLQLLSKFCASMSRVMGLVAPLPTILRGYLSDSRAL